MSGSDLRGEDDVASRLRPLEPHHLAAAVAGHGETLLMGMTDVAVAEVQHFIIIYGRNRFLFELILICFVHTRSNHLFLSCLFQTYLFITLLLLFLSIIIIMTPSEPVLLLLY